MLDNLHRYLRLKHLFIGALISLFSFNITYFIIKKVQIIESKKKRDSKIAVRFIQKNIPKGSKVVAPPLYGYAIRESQAEFRFIDPKGTIFTDNWKEKTYLYPFNYVIITDHYKMIRPEVVDYYLKSFELKKIDEIHFNTTKAEDYISKFLSNTERHGYGATIYQRIN